MSTALVIIFAVVFGTTLLSLLLVMGHEILRWWFNNVKASNTYHIGELNKEDVYIIVGIALIVILILLFKSL